MDDTHTKYKDPPKTLLFNSLKGTSMFNRFTWFVCVFIKQTLDIVLTEFQPIWPCSYGFIGVILGSDFFGEEHPVSRLIKTRKGEVSL